MEVVKSRRRNKEKNSKHQSDYLSDPVKMEKHKALMRIYYQNNKAKIIERSKLRYVPVSDRKKVN